VVVSRLRIAIAEYNAAMPTAMTVSKGSIMLGPPTPLAVNQWIKVPMDVSVPLHTQNMMAFNGDSNFVVGELP
jgi:hypothetical protein